MIPFQLAKHFWPSFSYVLGQRVDYLSPTLFASDILIFCLFLLKGKNFSLNIGYWFWAILLILSLGVFLSASPTLGWLGLLKFIELVFVGWIISQEKEYVFSKMFWVLSIDLFLEGILGILQFVNQRSLNGLWYLFGERSFSSSTPGIANATIHGQLILRPYATFPHPNVFAGFLVISLLLFLSMSLFPKNRKYQLWSIVAIIFGSIVLLLTLSRAALLVWLVLLILGIILRFGNKSWIYICVVFFFLVGIVLINPFFSGRFFDTFSYMESLDLRILLQNAAVGMWIHSPLLGVGLNNFLIELPSFIKGHVLFGFLQPVHNIFLLILAETGIIGLGAFIILLTAALIKGINNFLKSPSTLSLFVLLSLCVIILIGLTDHYFLTLQQGQLLFALVLGLSLGHGTIRIWPFSKTLRRIRSTK